MITKDEHYSGDYSNNPWAEMSDYNSPHSQSPAAELHSYGFVPSPTEHGMHLEPFARPMHSIYSGAQNTQPLFTAQWPSMLTNPSSQPQPPPMAAPPPPIAPVTTFATATPLPPLTTPQPTHHTSSRRTLTDQDRRRMCQYHEDNPTVKQTEIGGR